MLDVNLGDKVQTNDGHIGIVVKKYHVTGIVGMYVHIQEADGRIWYCPKSCIVKKGADVNEEAGKGGLADILRRMANQRLY